ncbi:MAG TPA: hypothetical protein VEA69_21805 [Tepidisphaeraceae bacterium]|nr:hypothetical protein [Tepidisphaeraceae bacterium]
MNLPIDAIIRRIGGASRIDYMIEDEMRMGWAKELTAELAVEWVDTLGSELEVLDIRVFAGASPLVPIHSEITNLSLFLLPGLPAPYIADFCQVGASAQQGSDSLALREEQLSDALKELLSQSPISASQTNAEPRISVRSSLISIQEIQPFTVTFASPYTIEAKFLRAVDQSSAAKIEEIIYAIDPDIENILEGETMADVMIRSGGFKMWWD